MKLDLKYYTSNDFTNINIINKYNQYMVIYFVDTKCGLNEQSHNI